MKLLDLFCCAGGASKGYALAGFEVTGLDVKHGKRYPFTYLRRDFDTVTVAELQEYDAIHASPPCQTHSITKHLREAQGGTTSKLDLLEPVRELLIESGKPYVIENVKGAPLINPIQICGSAFGLKVRRHRLFESNIILEGTKCKHKEQGKPVGVYGAMNDNPQGLDKVTGKYVYGGTTAKTIEEAREAMGIDWMIWGELVEAIPPAYTEYIGKQLMKELTNDKQVIV